MIDSNSAIQISIDEIKHDLSAYLRRVKAGETFIIVEAGRPMAELKPMLICQAIKHGLTIVTADDVICSYPVPVLSAP